MMIYLIRHGKTEYNRSRRYQGTSDIPLSPEGRAELTAAGFSPSIVYVTPLRRTAETAAILFPGVPVTVIPDLREMDFGVFEGRNYLEMEQDAQYRAWIASQCRDRCPGGESLQDCADRVCAAFAELVDSAFDRQAGELVIVAHGGTQMAIMERFAVPKKDAFHWIAPNGCGYILETDRERWQNTQTVTCLDTICCTKRKDDETC